MASDKSDDAKIPLTGLLILLTVLGGILYYQQPFKSDRPVNEQQDKVVIVGDKRVQSRLWQDPFASVKAHINAEADSRQSQTVPIAPHPLHPQPKDLPRFPRQKTIIN
ncbi:MAG: hypothetical protein R3B95_13760 [Nitrospirales bacterium]|nr:hypothetical protein [Nitrospirales bacterium]